jgi:hypothetical protein
MTIEHLVSHTNEFYFLREFTFSAVTFSPTAGAEVELADGVIWLDDLAVVFQMKERFERAGSSTDADNRWFENKVIKKATRQIRDTLDYLNRHDPISVVNNYGQTVPLSVKEIKTIHKVVVFREPNPQGILRPKFHISRTAGAIHLIPIADYIGIVRSLLTLSEISEYLSWRASLRIDWPSEAETLPEQSLVGHYLRGEKNAKPSLNDQQNLLMIEEDIEKWDVTGILSKFLELTTDDEAQGLRYHRIIREVAKLHRGELRTFKERFILCMNACKVDEFCRPYRFTSPRTGCGFVFVPLQSEFREVRRNGLVNLTAAGKYEQHLDKCIGLSFVRDDDGWFTVDWCLHEAKWEFDEEIQSRLAEFYPFRPVKEQVVYRYPLKTVENDIWGAS